MPIDNFREIANKFWCYHSTELVDGVVTLGHYGGNLVSVIQLLDCLIVKGQTFVNMGTVYGKIAFKL